MLVADPQTRSVRCRHLVDGSHAERPFSSLLDVAMSLLEREIGWPG